MTNFIMSKFSNSKHLKHLNHVTLNGVYFDDIENTPKKVVKNLSKAIKLVDKHIKLDANTLLLRVDFLTKTNLKTFMLDATIGGYVIKIPVHEVKDLDFVNYISIYCTHLEMCLETTEQYAVSVSELSNLLKNTLTHKLLIEEYKDNAENVSNYVLSDLLTSYVLQKEETVFVPPNACVYKKHEIELLKPQLAEILR